MNIIQALTVFATKINNFRKELVGKIVLMDRGELQLRLDLADAHKMATECLKLLNGLPGKLYKNVSI